LIILDFVVHSEANCFGVTVRAGVVRISSIIKVNQIEIAAAKKSSGAARGRDGL
jgi:hypothetical protein